MTLCISTIANGDPCTNSQIPGSQRCALHTRIENQKEAKSLKAKMPIAVRSVSGILNLIERTVNDLRDAKIDEKHANAIGKLAMVALHCVKAEGEGEKKRQVMAMASHVSTLTPEQIAEILDGKRTLDVKDGEDLEPN